jgi:hypothetical protein
MASKRSHCDALNSGDESTDKTSPSVKRTRGESGGDDTQSAWSHGLEVVGRSMDLAAVSLATVVQGLISHDIRDSAVVQRGACVAAGLFEAGAIAVKSMETALMANEARLLPQVAASVCDLTRVNDDDDLRTGPHVHALGEAFRHAMRHLVNVGQWMLTAGTFDSAFHHTSFLRQRHAPLLTCTAVRPPC